MERAMQISATIATVATIASISLAAVTTQKSSSPFNDTGTDNGIIASVITSLQPPVEEGQSPLVKAAAQGQVSTLDTLLKNGAKIDQEDPRGGNALSAAIQHRQMAAFNYLILHGANINLTYSGDMKGQRPIVLAKWAGNAEMISQLTKLGADANDEGTNLHTGVRNPFFGNSYY